MTALPPAPWTWRRIDPGLVYDRTTPERDADSVLDASLRQPAGEQGWALVAADGTEVLSFDGGYGSPEVAGGLPGPVADLLARAPELAERVRELEDQLRALRGR
jgi:hypothetical protein